MNSKDIANLLINNIIKEYECCDFMKIFSNITSFCFTEQKAF